MKDLTTSNVTRIMEQHYANAQKLQNMVETVTKLVKLAKKLKSMKLEMIANVLEPKLELNSRMMIVKIVKLAIIPKDHVTKNVLKKLGPMEQKILVMLAIPLSQPVILKMEMFYLVLVYPIEMKKEGVAQLFVKPLKKENL